MRRGAVLGPAIGPRQCNLGAVMASRVLPPAAVQAPALAKQGDERLLRNQPRPAELAPLTGNLATRRWPQGQSQGLAATEPAAGCVREELRRTRLLMDSSLPRRRSKSKGGWPFWARRVSLSSTGAKVPGRVGVLASS